MVRRPLASVSVVAVLLLISSLPVRAQIEQTQRVPRIRIVGDWRNHAPDEPMPGNEPWTPNDVAHFMKRFPDAIFRVEKQTAPIGNTHYLEAGERVRQLKAEAAKLGVDVDGRLCIGLRPDVFHVFRQGLKHCDPSRGGGGCDIEGSMDGSYGEKENIVKASGLATGGSETTLVDAKASWWPERWQHRLLVLRPGMTNEESRRVVANDPTRIVIDRAWATPPSPADRYEVRGSFDPRWFQRVPRQVHADTVQRLWVRKRDVCDLPDGRCKPPAEPLDPFDPKNRRGWAPPMDRDAVLALSTPDSVAAIYGFVRNATSKPGVLEDPYFDASSVVLRIDDPDFRTWKTRYVLYKLRDAGFVPGDSPCILPSYKPGWHAYYDTETHGPSGEICETEESNMWTGPSHVCRRDRPRRVSPGGPFHPTQFGPGVFEKGISAFLLEMITTLEQNGYRKPRVITTERPKYGRGYWNVLSPELRQHAALAGELSELIDPSLSLISRRPDAPAAPPTPPSAPPSAPPPAGEAPAPPPPEDSSPQPPPSWSLGSGGSSSSAGGRSPEPRSGAQRVRATGGGSGGAVEAPSRE